MSKAKLFAAVQGGDIKGVRALLDAEPELIRAGDARDRTALHLACSVDGDARPLVRLLLDRGADLEALSGKDKCPPLFFAVARSRDPRLVKFLLDRGAKVKNAPGGGLFAAAWYGDLKNLALLIDAGAAVDVKVGWTPFLAAWNIKQFDAAKLLVRSGADPDFQDPKSGRTALHYGIEKEFDPAQLRWLVQHGASPDVRDGKGVTARDKASRKRDKKWFEALQ